MNSSRQTVIEEVNRKVVHCCRTLTGQDRGDLCLVRYYLISAKIYSHYLFRLPLSMSGNIIAFKKEAGEKYVAPKLRIVTEILGASFQFMLSSQLESLNFKRLFPIPINHSSFTKFSCWKPLR